MQRGNNMDKKDLSQNCDFDDDSGKNNCWHCIHFLFPLGCMYGEDIVELAREVKYKAKENNEKDA